MEKSEGEKEKEGRVELRRSQRLKEGKTSTTKLNPSKHDMVKMNAAQGFQKIQAVSTMASQLVFTEEERNNILQRYWQASLVLESGNDDSGDLDLATTGAKGGGGVNLGFALRGVKAWMENIHNTWARARWVFGGLFAPFV